MVEDLNLLHATLYKNISSIFPRKSETFASEFWEIPEEMFVSCSSWRVMNISSKTDDVTKISVKVKNIPFHRNINVCQY